MKDIDLIIFLYVTQCPDFDERKMSSLAFDARKYYDDEPIDFGEASDAVNKIISLAFQPLDFFPQASEELAGGKEVRFDCDWCASMISTVHQMTRTPTCSDIENASCFLCLVLLAIC